MIVTSVGLLVVAFVLLVVGIVKSGASYLVLSAFATLAAGGFLYASFIHYRNKAILEGRLQPSPDGAVIAPGYPAAYGGAAPAAVMPAASALAPTFTAYEGLDAKQATGYADTLNLDELHALRRFEVEHDNRRTVLRAIDTRIDSIISLRRSLSSAS